MDREIEFRGKGVYAVVNTKTGKEQLQWYYGTLRYIYDSVYRGCASDTGADGFWYNDPGTADQSFSDDRQCYGFFCTFPFSDHVNGADTGVSGNVCDFAQSPGFV